MGIQNRIIVGLLFTAAAITCLFYASAADAGVPLKGVDVNVGMNPGGNYAARSTDAGGKADFGVWPKGTYTLDFGSAASPTVPSQVSSRAASRQKLHVIISGTTVGRLERDVNAGQAPAQGAPLQFTVDGTRRLVVMVSAAN